MAELNEDVLEISDEDFAKLPVPGISTEDVEDTEDGVDVDDAEVETTDTEDKEEKEEDTEEEQEADFGDDEESSDDEVETPIEEEKQEDSTKESAEDTFDYKAAFKSMLAPFKANGREVTPKSKEDLIRLAQMGANYHQKMAGMKPARKALKILENNDLLDNDELSFLIDIKNGNPEAINKLVKKHGIDPLDINVKEESTYTPSDHSISDAEVKLDEVLDDIKHSPSYDKTINAITKEWDTDSRTQAATHPQIISVINEHMESGVYDQVMDAVRYERSLGNMKGVSDFDAYGQMGNKLESEGAFNDPATSDKQKADPVPKVVPNNPVKEAERKAKKKAASPTKSTPVTKLAPDFNPLNMTDEEFAKFDPKTIGL